MSLRAGMRWTVRHGVVRGALWQARRSGDLATLAMAQPALLADPYGAYDEIRSQGLFVDRRLAMVTASHRAASAVLRDNALGMVLDMSALPAPLRLMARLSPDPTVNGPLDPPSLLAIDPPDHTRLRRLVSKVFTPRAVDGLRGEVERAADALLDAMAGEGTVDLVDRYASRLPVTVIATILGVPAAMHAQFLAWGTAAAATLDFGLPYGTFRRVERAQQAINTWLRGHFERLRRDPGEDILSQLVRLVDDGDRLTETELIATAQLLLAAGFETTVNLLGNGAALLMEHPDQLEYLRSGPDRWPNAVEEILRFEGPVQMTARVAYEDVDVLGTAIPTGRLVAILLGGVNRDPAVFTEPDVLDVTRPNAREHLAFSGGIHYCVGAALARMEGEVGLRALFERYPGLARAGQARRRPTQVLHGYATLPVTLRPRAGQAGRPTEAS
ncbi:putative cytochrome P450 140 [Parafrankia sp. Ea1.12]|nr:cytochrome P450 [Parafrankia sp. BMG5.11]SQD96090.1 putative cytochrome P450 140 [Parafrankia sp. Ea1.12]